MNRLRIGDAWRPGRLLAAGSLATLLLAVVAPNVQADELVQLGTGSTSPGTGAGARTTLTAPALGPNYPSGTPARYYWIGTTLADGTFFQAGYADPALDSQCAGLEWFVYSQVGGNPAQLWQQGGCPTSGTRTFSLVNTGWNQQLGKYDWRAKMGSTLLTGHVYSSQQYLPVNATGVVSEVSTTGTFNHSAPPGLPSVTYVPAVEIQLASGSWVAQSTGRVYRANTGVYWTPCPPFVIADLGTNSVRLYSDTSATSCLADGTLLW